MFESLTSKLTKVFSKLSRKGHLSENNIADALSEVRKAFLSADVSFDVTQNFIESVKSDCIGQKVIKSVSPGQQTIKIVSDKLVEILGGKTEELESKKPLKVLMIGLQGAGKTTFSAKLANLLQKKEYSPLLVPCDIYRPAAIDQLITLAQQSELAYYDSTEIKNVSKIAKKALKQASKENQDAIIFDTAGRLQVDENLIDELKDLKSTVKPDEILLVADGALGQEAVNVASKFHKDLGLTGIILTKLDGDARAGAALSMKSVTGVPIKFVGHGEKIDDIEIFHPDRIAQRILGMGDVVSLVEKTQEKIAEDEAERLTKRALSKDFNFEDFLVQIRQMKKLGPLSSISKFLPGSLKSMSVGQEQEEDFKSIEAIILSMTKTERSKPALLLNTARQARIAKGSGSTMMDIKKLLKRFKQMKKMMQKFKKMKNPEAQLEEMMQSSPFGKQ